MKMHVSRTSMVGAAVMVAALASGASAFWGSSSSDALRELTSETFDELIPGEKVAFVEFYAPWCGHCKRLAPTWKAMAERVHSRSDLDAVVAKIDCTKHRDTCNANQVRGYPTMLLFEANERTGKRYQGPRDTDELVKFVESSFAAED